MTFLVQESWTSYRSIEVDEPDRETALEKYRKGYYDAELSCAETEDGDDIDGEVYDMGEVL